MLKEICITPQVFDRNNLNESNYKNLEYLLQHIMNSGYILGLHNQEWIKAVKQNINTVQTQEIKTNMLSMMDLLKDKKRIQGHPKSGSNPISEEEWLDIACNLNQIREFDDILATTSYNEKTLSIEKLGDTNIHERFSENKLTIQKIKNNLKNILLPLLSYSKKITIIDPYFYINEKKSRESLKLIAKYTQEKRGSEYIEKGKIIINCCITKRGPNFKEWQNYIKEIEDKHKHEIIIQVWEDHPKFHDRFLITDIAGIESSNGFDLDIDDKGYESRFTLLSDKERNEQLNRFKENSSPFELKYIINASNKNP